MDLTDTLSIMMLSIMIHTHTHIIMKQRIIALSLMDLTVTLSMNDTQYNDTHLEYRFNVIIPCVIKKSIPFLLFLMSFC